MPRLSSAFLSLLIASAASAADVKETFSTGGAVASGTTVGSCQQLQVTLAGGGSVTLGSGATIQTPSAGDAAILSSATPLPAGDYKVSVEIAGINYPGNAAGGPENGSTLIAITDTPPQTDTETWWASHRVVGFEADTPGGATQQNTIYVNYWASGVMYTWSGSQWASGDPGWLPAATHDGVSQYTFTIQKAGGQYTLTMSQGGSTIVQAQVAVASTTPAAAEYLVIGDRLTDAFNGSMRVVSVTMPATCGGPNPPGSDGGVAPKSDLSNPDPPLWGDGGSWLTPDAKSKNKANGRPVESGCTCSLDVAPSGASPLLSLLGLFLLRLVRRRR
jgi:MYXO-CTERM domain-containing protein